MPTALMLLTGLDDTASKSLLVSGGPFERTRRRAANKRTNDKDSHPIPNSAN